MKPIEILSANVYGQEGAFLPGLSRDSARLLIEGSGPGVFQLAAADAQALADLRTLDEWRNVWGRSYSSMRDIKGRELCILQEISAASSETRNETFDGATPEAARALAAAWVREQAKGAKP